MQSVRMSATNDLPLVLLVEDARSYRMLMRRMLSENGDGARPIVRLVEAGNSLDALQVLHNQDPADPVRLVIADDRMPGLQGLELLEIVGKLWPKTSRLLLSAYTTGEIVMTMRFPVVDKDRPDWLIRDLVMKLAGSQAGGQ